MNLQTPVKPTMTQLTPEAMTMTKLWTVMMTRKTTRFSSYVAQNDVTVFEAAELDTWNDDLDPEVSAQLVQASAQAYFSFGKDKGTKVRARADILFDRHVD